jgi:hypothetical protein
MTAVWHGNKNRGWLPDSDKRETENKLIPVD